MSDPEPDGPAPEPGATDPASPPADGTSGTAARRARQQSRRATGGDRGGRPGGRPAPEPDAEASARVVVPRRDLDPDLLAAMEEERAFLLGSLDDLEREHDAGDVDDVDYAVLKDDYTARAATVIRAIDERHAAFEQARAPRRRGRLVAWVALLLVASIGIGVFVAQSSGRRDPGDSVSGDIRLSTRDQLLNARTLMNQTEFVEAIALYDEVLAAQPANTEALTYKGWLLFLTSRQAEVAADSQLLTLRARELLDNALAIDPDYADARIFRAQVYRELGMDEQALTDLDAVDPGGIPPFMQDVVGRLRDDLESRVGSAPGTTAAP